MKRRAARRRRIIDDQAGCDEGSTDEAEDGGSASNNSEPSSSGEESGDPGFCHFAHDFERERINTLLTQSSKYRPHEAEEEQEDNEEEDEDGAVSWTSPPSKRGRCEEQEEEEQEDDVALRTPAPTGPRKRCLSEASPHPSPHPVMSLSLATPRIKATQSSSEDDGDKPLLVRKPKSISRTGAKPHSSGYPLSQGSSADEFENQIATPRIKRARVTKSEQKARRPPRKQASGRIRSAPRVRRDQNKKNKRDQPATVNPWSPLKPPLPESHTVRILLSKLKFAAAELPRCADQKKILALLMDSVPDEDDEEYVLIKESYRHPVDTPLGRTTSGGGLQQMKNELLAFLIADDYVDCDAINAHMTFLYDALVRHGLNGLAPILERIVKDRQGVFDEIAVACTPGLHPDTLRKAIKGALNKALYLGNYRRESCGIVPQNQLIDDFLKEMQAVGTALKALYPGRFRQAELLCSKRRRDPKNDKSTNPLAVLLSWICQMMEAACIGCAMEFLEARWARQNPKFPAVGVYKYDGFLVQKSLFGSTLQEQKDLCRELTEFVQTTKQISHIAFTLKPMKNRDFLARYKPDCFDTMSTEWVNNLPNGLILDDERISRGLDDYDPANLIDWYIRSSYGTGKSYLAIQIVIRQLCDYILKKYGRQAYILSIVPRKTLCAQQIRLLEEFGFIPYHLIGGKLDFLVNPRTVWQIDSVARALQDHEGPVPDLVWVDECLTNVGQCFWTDKSQRSTVTRALASLSAFAAPSGMLSKVPRLLIMDADLSQSMVQGFTETVRRGRPYRVIKNRHQPWKTQLGSVTVYLGPSAETTLAAKLHAAVKVQNDLRQAGKPYTGVIVACHSRKLCNALAKSLITALDVPEELIAVYTSESDERKKREDFCNVAQAWANMIAVFHTATMNVGVDAMLRHLREAFLFLSSHNAPVSESLQMAFRARLLEILSIAFSGSCDKSLPNTVEELLHFATMSEETRRLIPSTMRADRNPALQLWSTKEPERNPADLGELVEGTFVGRCWQEYTLRCSRSQRDFVGRLDASLRRLGLNVRYVETKKKAKSNQEVATVTPGVMKKTRQVLREAKKQGEDDRVKLICDNVARELDNKTMINATWRADRTAEEIAGQHGVELMSIFAVDLAAVQSPVWVKFYLPFQEVYERLKKHFVTPLPNQHGPFPTLCSTSEQMFVASSVISLLFGFELKSFDGRTQIRGKAAKVGDDLLVVLELSPAATRAFLESHALGQVGRAFRMPALGKVVAMSNRSQVLIMSRLKSWLLPLLTFLGLTIKASYSAEEKRKHRAANSYTLSWRWLAGKKKASPPKPIPRSPTSPAYIVTETNGASLCRHITYIDTYIHNPQQTTTTK